jgi:hypothetical protein
MRCPGSWGAEQSVERQTSAYADEGLEAHDLAYLCLTQRRSAIDLAQTTLSRRTNKKVDLEMAAYVQTYVDALAAYAQNYPTLFERRVDFSRHFGLADRTAWGTADAIVLAGTELQVHDLKYGRGVKVDAEENEQLMLYALGALDAAVFIGAEIQSVRLVIHQPRLNHVSEWTINSKYLLAFAERALKASAAAAAPDAPRIPGEKQCRFCSVKATCPALRAEVYRATTTAFERLPETDSDSVALGDAMAKVDMVETWAREVRAEVERRLLNTRVVPGWKLVEGRKGNRQWTDESAAVEAAKSVGADLTTVSVVSPAQAEKILGKARYAVVASLTYQKPGSPSVAPESDNRAAWSPPAVSAAFTDLTKE